MKRRRVLRRLMKVFFLGTLFGPYAKALEHLNSQELSNIPNDFQKKQIEAHGEFLLALQDKKEFNDGK